METFDFSQLAPEDLAQLLELGNAQDSEDELALQMQQALAMQQPQYGNHTTATGAALGGLADILRGIGGQAKQVEAQRGKRDLLEKQKQARALYFNLMRGPQPTTPPPLLAGHTLEDGGYKLSEKDDAVRLPFSWRGVPGGY